MTILRKLGLTVLVGTLLLLASTLSYVPSVVYGGAGDDTPLAVQQIITFAPLSSTPFYAALRADVADDGCTAPQSWRLRHRDSLPVTMIVQGMTATGEPTWHLTAKPWSFNHIGGYVRLLCPALHARLSGGGAG